MQNKIYFSKQNKKETFANQNDLQNKTKLFQNKTKTFEEKKQNKNFKKQNKNEANFFCRTMLFQNKTQKLLQIKTVSKQ